MLFDILKYVSHGYNDALIEEICGDKMTVELQCLAVDNP